MKTSITLNPGELTLTDLRAIWRDSIPLELHRSAYNAINISAATVRRIVERGIPAYGINTGFGKLAKTNIPNDQLEELQRNLILSHSVGTGELITDEVARGYSGIRASVIDTMLALYNAGIMPCIPNQFSAGPKVTARPARRPDQIQSANESPLT